MTPEYKTSMIRGLLQALVTGGGVFFTTFAVTSDWKVIISSTGAAVFTVLAGRIGVEGTADSKAGSAVREVETILEEEEAAENEAAPPAALPPFTIDQR